MRPHYFSFVFVLALSGCAIGQRTNYRGGFNFEPPPPKSDSVVVVAMQDKRSSVISGGDSEARVGTLRSIAGVPWEVKTSSGNPLAIDMGESIVTTLKKYNYNAVQLPVSLTDTEQDVVKKAQALGQGGKILYFILQGWRQHLWFSLTLTYCIELMVKDLDGKSIATSEQCGEEVVRDEPGFDSLSALVSTIMARLISDPQIEKAFNYERASGSVDSGSVKPVAVDPRGSKPISNLCPVDKVLKMKGLGLSDDEIREACK